MIPNHIVIVINIAIFYHVNHYCFLMDIRLNSKNLIIHHHL